MVNSDLFSSLISFCLSAKSLLGLRERKEIVIFALPGTTKSQVSRAFSALGHKPDSVRSLTVKSEIKRGKNGKYSTSTKKKFFLSFAKGETDLIQLLRQILGEDFLSEV